MNNSTDEEIVRNIRHGKTEDFREIVARYQKKIFSVGMRFFRNEEDSLDFTQEVFLRAYEHLTSFKGLSPFRFWIMKVAVNMGINKIKGRKTEEDSLPENPVSPYKKTEIEHANSEIRNLLINAMNELPPNYRICLDLYFFNGLSYHEISEITGIPVNTIKSNVFRAKIILRDHLKGTLAEEYHDM